MSCHDPACTGLHDVLMRFFLGFFDGKFRWLLVTVPARSEAKEHLCH